MTATEQDTAALAATQGAAEAVWGSGLQNPRGPREAEAQKVMESDQGFGEFDVTAGYTGDWPANTEPPGSVDNGGYGGA